MNTSFVWPVVWLAVAGITLAGSGAGAGAGAGSRAMAQEAGLEAALPARVQLPPPSEAGFGDLMTALANRQSGRVFADAELESQELGDLAWAAAGQNRGDGRFTYPTYRNYQDMILYVFLKSGVYRYDPAAHALEPVAGGDRRAATGMGDRMPWVASAAVNLVFVQDIHKWNEDSRGIAPGYGMMHAGLMMQSAGLYAASRQWSCVVRAFFDREAIQGILRLPEHQLIVITQSIGPAE